MLRHVYEVIIIKITPIKELAVHRPLAITLFALTLSACATDAARVATLPPPPAGPVTLADNSKSKIKCEHVKQTGSNRVTKRCYDVDEAEKVRGDSQEAMLKIQARGSIQNIKGN